MEKRDNQRPLMTLKAAPAIWNPSKSYSSEDKARRFVQRFIIWASHL